mgnify:CR=1 FL=1
MQGGRPGYPQRPPCSNKFLIALEYWPFFFIFYAANSIAVNSANRVEGQKEGFNLFICGLGNSTPGR